jgi:lytic cellulose monooxygenase (C1-hydroxylating)
VIQNNNTWTVTIPSLIKAGNYVLRHEKIALHQAESAGEAQNYP